MKHDPFDPGNHPANCPACQKKVSSYKSLVPVGENIRRCEKCGRTERWMKPHRKVHGDRRYQRFMADQRQKFGDLEVILTRWIADPDG